MYFSQNSACYKGLLTICMYVYQGRLLPKGNRRFQEMSLNIRIRKVTKYCIVLLNVSAKKSMLWREKPYFCCNFKIFGQKAQHFLLNLLLVILDSQMVLALITTMLGTSYLIVLSNCIQIPTQKGTINWFLSINYSTSSLLKYVTEYILPSAQFLKCQAWSLQCLWTNSLFMGGLKLSAGKCSIISPFFGEGIERKRREMLLPSLPRVSSLFWW